MRREPIQGFINRRVVRDRCLTSTKALEPRRALSIVGEYAVDVSSADAPIGRNRPLRRPVGKPSKRPRAVGPFGQAHMHLVSGKRDAVAGSAARRFEALVCGQNCLDVEQAKTIRATSRSLDSVRISYGVSRHLISAA